MILESMEQRVANTPVALLCDECLKKDCCKWVDEMRAAVVNTDKSCYGRPFKPEAWTCQLYLEEKPKDWIGMIGNQIGHANKYKDFKEEDTIAKTKLSGRYPWGETPKTEFSNYIPTEDSVGMIKGGG